MRKPVIIGLVWALSLLCNHLQSQTNVDLTESTDPSSLAPAVLAEQVDTTNLYRQSFELALLASEFPDARQVFVETYYQRSEDHLLLEMSKGSIPLHKSFLVSEGLGNTYWKISDGICWVLLIQSSSVSEGAALEINDRSCSQ